MKMTGFSAFSTASLRLENMSKLGIAHLQQKFRCTLKADGLAIALLLVSCPIEEGPPSMSLAPAFPAGAYCCHAIITVPISSQ